jgi:hypothetical protein
MFRVGERVECVAPDSGQLKYKNEKGKVIAVEAGGNILRVDWDNYPGLGDRIGLFARKFRYVEESPFAASVRAYITSELGGVR